MNHHHPHHRSNSGTPSSSKDHQQQQQQQQHHPVNRVSHNQQDFAGYNLNYGSDNNNTNDVDNDSDIIMALQGSTGGGGGGGGGDGDDDAVGDDLDDFMDAQMHMSAEDWSHEEEAEAEASAILLPSSPMEASFNTTLPHIVPPAILVDHHPHHHHHQQQQYDDDDVSEMMMMDTTDWAVAGAASVATTSTDFSFDRYTTTLEPDDVICAIVTTTTTTSAASTTGTTTMMNSHHHDHDHPHPQHSQHPGNVRMQHIVEYHMVQYGLATKESERDAIIDSILSQVLLLSATTSAAVARRSRFVFVGPQFTTPSSSSGVGGAGGAGGVDGTTTAWANSSSSSILISCREATAQETKDEIVRVMRQHFYLIPTLNCVIFGRGKPARDHPGNQALRAFIEPLRAEYANSSNNHDKKRLERSARDHVLQQAGGRFLLPFDKSRPADGCIEADEESIVKKIAHLFRHKPRTRGNEKHPHQHHHHHEHQQHQQQQQQRDDDDTNGIPFAHALPIINHMTATLATPHKSSGYSTSSSSSSSMSSSSSTTSSFSDTKKHHIPTPITSKTPPALVSVVGGQSALSSTLGIETAPATTTSSPNHQAIIDADDSKEQEDDFSQRFQKLVQNKRFLVAAIILILVVGTIIGIVVATSGGKGTDDDNSSSQSGGKNPSSSSSLTIDSILDRDYLVCGIPNQEGYGIQNPETGLWEGFEVDLCRAVAAAIFGRDRFRTRDEEPVQFVDLEANERFIALDNEEVDLLLAITTQNMERSVYEPTTLKGYTFSTPYLVNGLTFAGNPEYMGCLEMDPTNITETCEDAKICVVDGSTHKDIVLKMLPDMAVGSVVTPSTLETFYDHFISGGVCNILAGEQFDIAETVVRSRKYTGPYQVSDSLHSKELISMVTRDTDATFSDFVNWILQALISAEELRIVGSSNISPSELETSLAFGERFKFMFQDAFTVVGDYGQMYSKHLEPIVPRSPANEINLGDTPGMYAFELGTLETNSPPRSTNSPKLQEIKARGHLNCGITQTPIFAELDVQNNEWAGMDPDACKALSAAIFDGKIEVKFEVLSPSERFKALKDGRVDVLARVTTITLERDRMGLSFSYPNFRDQIRFAGIPKFRQCAENLDWNSGGCSGLIVCVTEATTQYEVLSEVFPPARLRVTNSSSETVESFSQSKCNVLAGGTVETSNASIEKWYSGPYDIGTDSFSRESLALVTLEDDVLWSKFVNWIVVATLYAEENGITQNTYLQMPRVDLFRPLIGDEMFRNAIRAVGSYAEIWERNAGSKGLVREGRNLLNTYPLNPLLLSDQNWYLPMRNAD